MGEWADWYVERQLDRLLRNTLRDVDLPKDLQDFAEEKADEAVKDKKTQELNKGTIQW